MTERKPSLRKFTRDRWEPGDSAWFEYHCYEGHDSSDAQAWYRSHQLVTVVKEAAADAYGETLEERAENGQPKVYSVRFPDGLKWDAFEDELLTDRAAFERPDPPPVPRRALRREDCHE